MKTFITAITTLFLGCSVAQTPFLNPDLAKQAAPAPRKASIGNEQHSHNLYKPKSAVASALDVIGNTFFDNQSNFSVDDRIHYDPTTGDVTAVWTMALSTASGYPDRGTGYNHRSASQWGNLPSSRLENVRTGWPSIAISDTSEVIISHDFAVPELLCSIRPPSGSGSWVTSPISNTQNGSAWARAAVGGPNNKTIHAIARSTPIAFGGTPQKGIDGPFMYYRSLDGGYNWDIIDSILPQLDSTLYYSFPADGYAIDAKGNTVVIAVFNSFDDSFILKSTDNGSTWTKTTFFSTPLTDYNPSAVGSISDVNNDAIADTITSTDFSGSVLIDNNGLVHLTYGVMRYIDDDPTLDADWFYFPATGGLMYWNENSSAPTMITSVLDLDNDGSIAISSINEIGWYYVSLTGQPSLGIDANNNIFCTYSMLSEIEFNTVQFYRKIYMISSRDGGSTWSSPKNLTPNRLFYETVFPSLARDVDSNLRLVYQEDSEPGMALRGDLDPDGQNDIVYLEIDTAATQFVSITENSVEKGSLSAIYPNPASNKAFIDFNVEVDGDYSIEINSITGQVVKQINLGNLQSGSFKQLINLENLENGIYVLTLHTAGYTTSRRLIIQK